MTNLVPYGTICIVRKKEALKMTYEEAEKKVLLGIALTTKRTTPIGYIPWEIKAAVLKILGAATIPKFMEKPA